MRPYYASTLAVPGSPLRVSRLGLGCARLFGGLEARASRRLIEAALSSGLRHFDTAPIYSSGQSEATLGDVLAGVRDVTVTTKVGIPTSEVPPSRLSLSVAYRLVVRPTLACMPAVKAHLLGRAARAQPRPNLPPPRRLERSEIERSVEGSLRRLRRDAVHLLLLHDPHQFLIDDELHAVFADLKRQGLCEAYGLAYDQMASSVPRFGTVVQARYSDAAIDAPRSATLEVLRPAVLRLWHGVVRANAGRSRDMISAGERIAAALARSPTTGVIFSASTRAQIYEVVRSVAHAETSA